MVIEVRRRGDGHVAVLGGSVGVADARSVLDTIEAEDDETAFIVADVTDASDFDAPFDELHDLVRRVRASANRGRRHAFVVDGAEGKARVEEYRTMVALMSGQWGDDGVEVEVFLSVDDAVDWAAGA